MKGLILSLILFSIILLSIDGQDNQNINKTLASIDHEVRSCECIPSNLCISKSPSDSIIDLHITDDGPCGNNSLVCCNEEDKVIYPPSEIENKPNSCGIRNSNGIGFKLKSENGTSIINVAQYGEFPWTVALLGRDTDEGSTDKSLRYLCGASLIHPQVVLTAAHCVNSKDKKFSIRAGEWDGQTENEFIAHQNRNVKNVIIHPDFETKGLHNDVALLILDVPLEIVANVQTVCLPPLNEVLENVTCFQSSWDKHTFEVEGKPHDILNKAKLRVVPQDDCQEHLRRSRVGAQFILDKSFICSENDHCNGSGGSPFVCPIPGKSNKYYLSGIQSWGLDCVDYPSIKVNVAKFRNWIDTEMLKSHFDASTYTA